MKTVEQRTAELIGQEQYANDCRTDRMFAVLMAIQWVAGIAAASWLSPRAWEGSISHVHFHVWVAVVLGGLLNGFPILQAWKNPGAPLTRHVIAAGQMLVSALLIHLSGGRVETHFHIFGSLAFLAFYRDWRVLLTATVTTGLDHLLRGMFAPLSVYGVLSATPWRTLEHAGWVVFEDVVLVFACQARLVEFRQACASRAALEHEHSLIERTVIARTAELQKSGERFRALCASAAVGVFETDAVLECTYANPAYLEMLGLTLKETLGMGWQRSIPPEDLEHVDDVRARIKRTGEVEDQQRYLRPDGESRWVCARIRSLHSTTGQVTGYVGAVEDITERKRAEHEWKRAREAAESASRAKSAFLANMSHEIRTPMNGVIGMTDLALQTDLTGEQRDCLETVRSSADLLLEIINTILDFSKIEAGKLELERIEFDLAITLRRTLQPLTLRTHEKRVELICDIGRDVPLNLVGDPLRLRQVLTNLAGNAIKFTPAGEIRVGVVLERREKDEVWLRFSVADTGIGIPPEKLEAIFRPFEQADVSTTRAYGGTGLGLSISSRLTATLGGSLCVESEPGRGSTFFFTVPLGLSVHAAPPRDLSLAGELALVVDDNASNRQILAATLHDWDVTPVMAESGANALELISSAQRPFDLVITDADMPGMDGFALVRRLRKFAGYETTPVLVLSSGGLNDLTLTQESGAQGYLLKPADRSELLEKLLEIRTGQEPARKSQSRAADKTKRRGHAGRILLAEDNVVNQKVARAVLSKAGYEVAVADNGAEALALLERDSFDVCLMDVQMPVMDGLTATRRLRQREKPDGRLPVIALTASVLPEDRAQCVAAGMDDFVSKPLDAKNLCAAVKRWMPAATEATESAHTDAAVPVAS